MINQVQAATVEIEIDTHDSKGIFIQTEYGNITGAFTLQERGNPGNSYATHATALTAPAGAGSNKTYHIDFTSAPPRQMKLTYTHTSGTGLLKVSVNTLE
jgi:hypothetical protein